MTTSSIGRTLRKTRTDRELSLEVVAGRAGITAPYLSMIERGIRTIDRRSLIVALADALEVAPSEIAAELVAPEGKMPQDRRLADVRRALMAVGVDDPEGQVLPAQQLQQRVNEIVRAKHECDYEFMGSHLAALIRDVHTTLKANRDEREVMRLAVTLHLQGTQAWLPVAGASPDLAWVAASFGQQAAERLDEPVWTALATFGTVHGLIESGAYKTADKALAAANAGTGTHEALVATGMIDLAASLLAAAKQDDSARTASLEEAAELAARLEQPDPWFGFGPANVALWKMSVSLEAGDHAGTANLARQINPAELPSEFRRANYWVNYGRALAKLPRQRPRAVIALREAEKIAPARVHRNGFARQTLSELVARAKKDAVGRELRAMAYRSGLPV